MACRPITWFFFGDGNADNHPEAVLTTHAYQLLLRSDHCLFMICKHVELHDSKLPHLYQVITKNHNLELPELMCGNAEFADEAFLLKGDLFNSR